MQSQLHWAGQVVRMKNQRLPKILLYSELYQGKRSQGQKKRFKNTLRSPWNLSVSSLIARNIWRRTETSGMKLSNVERKSVKPEEVQQLICERLPRQPLSLPFLVLTTQDSSAHRLVSLDLCTLTVASLNRKVDQMILIDYDWQRRCITIYIEHTHTHTHTYIYIYIYIYI